MKENSIPLCNSLCRSKRAGQLDHEVILNHITVDCFTIFVRERKSIRSRQKPDLVIWCVFLDSFSFGRM